MAGNYLISNSCFSLMSALLLPVMTWKQDGQAAGGTQNENTHPRIYGLPGFVLLKGQDQDNPAYKSGYKDEFLTLDIQVAVYKE